MATNPTQSPSPIKRERCKEKGRGEMQREREREGGEMQREEEGRHAKRRGDGCFCV